MPQAKQLFQAKHPSRRAITKSSREEQSRSSIKIIDTNFWFRLIIQWRGFTFLYLIPFGFTAETICWRLNDRVRCYTFYVTSRLVKSRLVPRILIDSIGLYKISSFPDYTLKLSPQPHSSFTFGFSNLNPSFKPSLPKSTRVPSR